MLDNFVRTQNSSLSTPKKGGQVSAKNRQNGHSKIQKNFWAARRRLLLTEKGQSSQNL